MTPNNDVPAALVGRGLDFYEVDASIISERARHLLTSYAGIAPEEVNEHVDMVRKRAFEIFPYPCIGMYRFLDLGLPSTGIYSEVIERLKNGEKFLDLGCCFGQEIRQLLLDGVPAANCYGSDLRQEFVDLGYELFRDREGEGAKIKFVMGDIFDESSNLNRLRGQPSIIYTGSFFHLFTWDEQFIVAQRIVALLKPERGALLVGRQVGNENAGVFGKAGYVGEKARFRHSPQSWKDFWQQVGGTTGTQWDVEAVLDPFGIGFGDVEKKLTELREESGARRLRFVVRRL